MSPRRDLINNHFSLGICPDIHRRFFIILKQCIKCRTKKPVSEFNKDKSRKDGLQNYCRDCGRRYRQEHKKEAAEYQKQYQKQYQKRYKQEHKKENVTYIKQYCLDHKKDKAIYDKQYRQENKEKTRLRMRLYHQTGQGKDVAKRARHKRRAFKLCVGYEVFSPNKILERDGYICQKCGKKTCPDFKNQYHPLYPNLDHIISLSKGGYHTRINTQCLCRQCNMEKGNRDHNDQLRAVM